MFGMRGLSQLRHIHPFLFFPALHAEFGELDAFRDFHEAVAPRRVEHDVFDESDGGASRGDGAH